MIQTTLKIDGMMCGMCESHINDAVRKDFPVKKVTASHSKGTCVKEQDIGPALLIVLLQGRHLGVSGDAAVDVVGVQNDNAAGEIGIRGSRGRLLCGAGGHGQRTGHVHCQEQGL